MSVAVAHVMTKKLVFTQGDRSIDQARELMASKRVHALPVVDSKQKLIGIVTTADVARQIDGNSAVRRVMSDIVVTIKATEPVSKAAQLMRRRRIHHLVVTDGGKAVGIVSSLDLLRLVAGAQPEGEVQMWEVE